MIRVSHRALDRIYSILLLFIVLLSWGFVIYAARITAIEQLKNKFPKLPAQLGTHPGPTSGKAPVSPTDAAGHR